MPCFEEVSQLEPESYERISRKNCGPRWMVKSVERYTGKSVKDINHGKFLIRREHYAHSSDQKRVVVVVAKAERSETSLANEFEELVAKWKRETFFMSSLTKQFAHPAYLRIMAMGEPAIPLVLREMQKTQDSWFYALKFMAGKDVTAGIKNFEDAKAKWLEWGYKNNYI